MHWRERFFGPAGRRDYIEVNSKWFPLKVVLKNPDNGISDIIPPGKEVYVLPKNLEAPITGKFGNQISTLVVPDAWKRDKTINLRN